MTNENLLHSTGNSMLCGDLKGEKKSKRRDTCICIADSLCYRAETNTMV